MERTVSLFRNNKSQAVRIPKEFELPGETVTITKQGDGSLLVRPIDDLVSFLRKCEPLPEEDWLPEIADPPAEPEDIF